MRRRSLLIFAPLLMWGCGPQAAEQVVDPSEWSPGGATSQGLLLGAQAFLLPAQNLTPEHEQAFYSGNAYFNQSWVEAPASTAARDGLGPLFNARSCSGCHFRDGKGVPPADQAAAPFVGLLIRLSVPGADGFEPEPTYGGQLQDQALPGVPVEAVPRVEWVPWEVNYPDGTTVSLRAPKYSITQWGYGDPHPDLLVSPRLAPHMIGLGLLEAIAADAIEAGADPDDLDHDGISGRVQRLLGPGGPKIGRFGWKADAPDVETQVARAFAGDMGLTSRLEVADDCTAQQVACGQEPTGGEPEIEDPIFERVTLYSRAVAVPVRRDPRNPSVLLGRQVFRSLGCDVCHVPKHRTGPAAMAELEDQTIWPYTDLLLHDMGVGLSDGRPVGSASGSEWKTPPLWGLGLAQTIQPGVGFLHDGRARTLEEAILWHDGEAEASRVQFMESDAEQRRALVDFLEDL